MLRRKSINRNNSKRIGNILWGLILFSIVGCGFIQLEAVQHVTIPEDMVQASKEEIVKKWGKPHKIYRRPHRIVKYDTDELWIYKYPVTSAQFMDYYFYFKDNRLLQWDYVSWP